VPVSLKLERSLTVLGALVVIGTIVFSFFGLRALEADIEAKEAQRADLDQRIIELNNEIDRLKHAPLKELVEMGAIAVKLDGKMDPNGRQLYDFGYWLYVPNNRKRDIARAEYRRRAGERLRNVLVGTEPSNGFGVSYLGWGCFRTVDVTIVETNGQTATIQFDQCAITRWGENE
jgi:hypothetical protein